MRSLAQRIVTDLRGMDLLGWTEETGSHLNSKAENKKLWRSHHAKRVREQLVHWVSFTGRERNYPNRGRVKNCLKALKGKRRVMSRRLGARETEEEGGCTIKSIIIKAVYSQHPERKKKKSSFGLAYLFSEMCHGRGDTRLKMAVDSLEHPLFWRNDLNPIFNNSCRIKHSQSKFLFNSARISPHWCRSPRQGSGNPSL